MVLMIILSIFSIDWFYQGIEYFKTIVVRTMVIKILNLISKWSIIKLLTIWLLITEMKHKKTNLIGKIQ